MPCIFFILTHYTSSGCYDKAAPVFLQTGGGVLETFGIVGFGLGFVFAVDADDEIAFDDVDAGVVWGTHHAHCKET